MYEAIISRVQKQQQQRSDMVAITVLFSCLRVFEYVFRYSGTSFEGPRLHYILIKNNTLFYKRN